jgi:hypothetical protein
MAGLATYKSPYALKSILNVDPSVMATPEPAAEKLAYAVAGEQAGIEGEARQNEERIALQKLALAQKAEVAKNEIANKRAELDFQEGQSKVALGISTAGAAVTGLGAYAKSKQIEGIIAKTEAYQGKMADVYSRIFEHLGIRGKTYADEIEEEKKHQPSTGAGAGENPELSFVDLWRKRK